MIENNLNLKNPNNNKKKDMKQKDKMNNKISRKIETDSITIVKINK